MVIKTTLSALAIIIAAPQAGAATISAYDQYTLELLNYFRANPQSVANTYLSGNLNEGLSAGTISADAKQPLAWDQSLVSSAQSHTTDMINNNYFDHTGSNGSSPFQRMQSAGYNYQTAGENLATRGASNLQGVDDPTTAQMNVDLFQDFDVTGRGHRTNMMDNSFESVGISVGYTPSYAALGNFPSEVVTLDFGANAQGAFLTGVAYNDLDNNNFYTPGEGLGGVSVFAYAAGTSILEGSTTTLDAGGYTLDLGAGTYDLEITGSLGTMFQKGVVIGNQNFKLDYTNVAAVPVPSAVWLFASGLVGLAGRLRRRG